MRVRVSAATSTRPFRTRDTVGTDTPASAAMAAMVTRVTRPRSATATTSLLRKSHSTIRKQC